LLEANCHATPLLLLVDAPPLQTIAGHSTVGNNEETNGIMFTAGVRGIIFTEPAVSGIMIILVYKGISSQLQCMG